MTIKYDIIIRNSTIFDGNDFYNKKDIAIADGIIADINENIEGYAAQEINGTGLFVSAGFVDMHSHMDNRLTVLQKPPINKITQGITTEITGQCGIGKHNLAEFSKDFYEKGSPTNFIHLTPHGTLRNFITKEKKLSSGQMQRMKDMLAKEMELGAWGMSSGLIYAPGVFTETSELVELCKVIAPMGGIYFTHLRSERDGILDAIDEAITIGKEANIQVHLAHLKVTGLENSHLAGKVIKKIEDARGQGLKIFADQYPYEAAATSLKILLPDAMLAKMEKEGENSLDKNEEQICLEFLKGKIENRGSDKIIFATLNKRPELAGKRLDIVAKELDIAEEKLVLDIIKEGNPATSLFFTIDSAVVDSIIKLPYVAVGTDGSGYDIDGIKERFPHPREIATFPEMLRKGKENGLSLRDIYKKFTSLPSGILNDKNIGNLEVGTKANITIIALNDFTPKANYEKPNQLTQGVNGLIVNGQFVIKDGKFTGNLPGQILTRTVLENQRN